MVRKAKSSNYKRGTRLRKDSRSLKVYWYNLVSLPKEKILEFFDELRRARNIILEEHGGISPEEWNHEVVQNKKFVPKGAVIHTSGMKSFKETLLCNNSGYFSSHFIIASNKYSNCLPKKEFPLLSQVPATIFMPFDLDTYIPHSGYLSPVTFGIEMRNLGHLRPDEEKFVRPIYEDANEWNFRLWKKKPIYYYSREENWTEPFEMPTYTWQGYHYEKFTSKQYLALCILVKCLTKLFYLNPALLLPSSAIIDKPHNCPVIPIDYLQKKISIIRTKDKQFKLNGLYALTDRSSLFIKNITTVKHEKESYTSDGRIIENRIRESMWRNTLDREKLIKVFKHGNAKFMNVFHKYKKAMEAMGYFIYEEYFTKSLQIYANAREIELDEDALCFELEKDFYNLVSGVYDD
jgi:hypothetical protein